MCHRTLNTGGPWCLDKNLRLEQSSQAGSGLGLWVWSGQEMVISQHLLASHCPQTGSGSFWPWCPIPHLLPRSPDCSRQSCCPWSWPPWATSFKSQSICELWVWPLAKRCSGGSYCHGAVEMNPTRNHEVAVWSLASLSVLRIWCCHELWCRSQTWFGSRLLWLWCSRQL